MKNGSSAVVTLGLLAALAAGPAIAQDSGFYIGGGGGYAQFMESCERATVPCDDTTSSFRGFGGYQFNRNWQLEVGYVDLGKVTGSGATGTFELKADGWDVSGVVSIPVAGDLSFIGRLGYFYVRTVLDQTGPAFGVLHGASTDGGFIYGAGASYTLGRLGLRAEWFRYVNVGGSQTGQDDVNILGLSALFRF